MTVLIPTGIIMVLSEVYCRWMKFGLSKCRIRTYFMRLTVVLFIICVNTRLLPKVDLQAIRKLQPVLYYGMQMKQNVHVIQGKVSCVMSVNVYTAVTLSNAETI